MFTWPRFRGAFFLSGVSCDRGRMKFSISKLAHELLGDDLAKLDAQACIRRGYWMRIRAPDDARTPEVRGQEFRVPVVVDAADNNKFREITEKDRQH